MVLRRPAGAALEPAHQPDRHDPNDDVVRRDPRGTLGVAASMADLLGAAVIHVRNGTIVAEIDGRSAAILAPPVR